MLAIKRSLVCAVCAVCTLALSGTGCYRPIGPQSVARDRRLDATSLSDSWKEQTLLNIVKIRYFDPPLFVDVGNIVANYSWQTGVTGSGNIVPGGTSAATIGGFGTYSNTPTITYSPLTGAKFIRALATPLPPETVFSSIEAGLAADVILFASVASINGLQNQEATLQGIAPADADFHRVRALMRNIQLADGVRVVERKEAGEEMVSFLTFRPPSAEPEIQADIAEFRRLLKLDPTASEYKIIYDAIPGNDKEIAVITRSILGLMEIMAAEVGVPAEDIAQSRAFPGYEEGKAAPPGISHRLIHIHSGKSSPPDAFVSVKYRNNWFWIDDHELESKQMFALVMMLFSMADTAPKENQPVLTIPTH